MTLKKIKELLKAQTLYDSELDKKSCEYAQAADLMSDVLSYATPGVLLLTALTNSHVIRTCEVTGITAVVFVRAKMPSSDTVDYAQQCNISLLATSYSMFEACGILYNNGLEPIKTKK